MWCSDFDWAVFQTSGLEVVSHGSVERRFDSETRLSPVTHGLASWLIADGVALSRRELLAITVAGILPDLDGLGIALDLLGEALGIPQSNWYEKYHHHLLHGGLGAVVVLIVTWLIGCRNRRSLIAALFAFHLHLFCDVVGSRGPGVTDVWPIHYLAPFSDAWTVEWSKQWVLNGWQNVSLTGILLLLTWNPQEEGNGG